MHRNNRHYNWVHNADRSFSLAWLDRFHGVKHQCNLFMFCKIVPVGFSDYSLVLCGAFIKLVNSMTA